MLVNEHPQEPAHVRSPSLPPSHSVQQPEDKHLRGLSVTAAFFRSQFLRKLPRPLWAAAAEADERKAQRRLHSSPHSRQAH